MIFWIFVIATGVGVIGLVLSDIFCWFIEDFLGYLFTIVAIITVIMLTAISFANMGAGREKAYLEQKYNALIYKLEAAQSRDDFGFINKEYIDEIQEWNEEIASKQIAQDNFWTGIFVPDIYDDFSLIDLHSMQYK